MLTNHVQSLLAQALRNAVGSVGTAQFDDFDRRG
jgi:hypothetical protein